MHQPLEDITVLDLSRILAGPYCSMLFSDFGARVIKIEDPVKSDDTRNFGPPFQKGESAYFMSVNRGKESIGINLKAPEGKAIIEQLIKKQRILGFGSFSRGGFLVADSLLKGVQAESRQGQD